MDIETYLRKVLALQTLSDDSQELKALQGHRAAVEKLLRENFDSCSPTIRYGGSKAKGTMIKEAYDLDIICYFPNDDSDAGETLQEIFNNVRNVLESRYLVVAKTSALRLHDSDPSRRGVDFFTDVVPGRFTDETQTDAFLYQASGEKERLKTNLDTHIAHIRDSGVTDAIRLLKLWKVRNGIRVKTFVLELAVVKLLCDRKKADLASQLVHVWTELRDRIDELFVEDPANPEGNDLTPALDEARASLTAVARRTLTSIDTSGWEEVFGSVTQPSETERSAGLRRAASAAVPTRPWSA